MTKEIHDTGDFTLEDMFDEIHAADHAEDPPDGAFRVQEYVDYVKENFPDKPITYPTARRMLFRMVDSNQLEHGHFRFNGRGNVLFFWRQGGVEKG